MYVKIEPPAIRHFVTNYLGHLSLVYCLLLVNFFTITEENNLKNIKELTWHLVGLETSFRSSYAAK